MSVPRSNERAEAFDRRAGVDEAHAATRSVWSKVKVAFADDVVELVDDILGDAAILSFGDIGALELAETARLMKLRAQEEDMGDACTARIDKVKAGGRGNTKEKAQAAVDALTSMRAFHRKNAEAYSKQIAGKLRHLRLITERTGGGKTALAATIVRVPKKLSATIALVKPDALDSFDPLAPVDAPKRGV